MTDKIPITQQEFDELYLISPEPKDIKQEEVAPPASKEEQILSEEEQEIDTAFHVDYPSTTEVET